MIYEDGNFWPGWDLPYRATGHCLARIGPDTIAMLGGRDNLGEELDNFYTFDIPSETWARQGDMPEEKFNHGCGYAR